MNKFRVGFLLCLAVLCLLMVGGYALTATPKHAAMGLPREFWSEFNGQSDFSWFFFLLDMAFFVFASYRVGRGFEDHETYAGPSQSFRRFWRDRDVADSLDLLNDRDNDLSQLTVLENRHESDRGKPPES